MNYEFEGRDVFIKNMQEFSNFDYEQELEMLENQIMNFRVLEDSLDELRMYHVDMDEFDANLSERDGIELDDDTNSFEEILNAHIDRYVRPNIARDEICSHFKDPDIFADFKTGPPSYESLKQHALMKIPRSGFREYSYKTVPTPSGKRVRVEEERGDQISDSSLFPSWTRKYGTSFELFKQHMET